MTLISTIAQIRKYVSISGDSTYSKLEPSLKQAESKEIKAILGQHEYEALVADITDGEPGTAKYIGLIEYVRDVMANYAMVRYVGVGNVSLGDLGMQEENYQNSNPASKWKVIEAKKDLMSFGDEAVDRLLEFLEENEGTYTLWAASEAYTLTKVGMIHNTDQLSAALGQTINRSLFVRLKPHLVRAERMASKLVGAAQYAELQTQLKEDTLTADNSILVEKLRTIVAHEAITNAMPLLSLQLRADGIYMSTLADGINREVSAKPAEVKVLRDAYREIMVSDIDEIKFYLISNVDDYPLYEASGAYTARPVPGPRRPVVNTAADKGFGV